MEGRTDRWLDRHQGLIKYSKHLTDSQSFRQTNRRTDIYINRQKIHNDIHINIKQIGKILYVNKKCLAFIIIYAFKLFEHAFGMSLKRRIVRQISWKP